jgi:hypothetical protein
MVKKKTPAQDIRNTLDRLDEAADDDVGGWDQQTRVYPGMPEGYKIVGDEQAFEGPPAVLVRPDGTVVGWINPHDGEFVTLKSEVRVTPRQAWAYEDIIERATIREIPLDDKPSKWWVKLATDDAKKPVAIAKKR